MAILRPGEGSPVVLGEPIPLAMGRADREHMHDEPRPLSPPRVEVNLRGVAFAIAISLLATWLSNRGWLPSVGVPTSSILI